MAELSSFKLIGVCLSTIHMEDRFYFIKSLNQHAVSEGYRLLIFNTCTDLYDKGNPNDDGERSVFQLSPYESLSAMIVFPHFLYNDPVVDTVIETCKAQGVPVIAIDKDVSGCLCFRFAYANIFERLCAHVVDDHHAKNLLMMAGVRNNQYSDERIAAFRKVLTERGMYYDDSLIGYGDFWDGPALNVMREWFEEEGRPFPDAIICANDSMAIAVSSYLQKHGCRVPEDCIVTGFDCILQSRYHIPNLTTCRQDYDAMGSRIMQTVGALQRGETVPHSQVIGFSLIRSQSCGCKPVSFHNINDASQEMYNSLRNASKRQEVMCAVQADIARMRSVAELPEVLSNRFIFPTIVLAINQDIFEGPDFGRQHSAGNAFTDSFEILFQRYFWYQKENCVIQRQQLIPEPDILFNREEPVIVCPLHFIGQPLGYCVFQPDITVDEYEKMHIFMNALDASFGAFHSQMQIRAINEKLAAVNAELEQLYIHDHLTGLLNRRGFFRLFRQSIAELHDADMQVFLISVDLDGLKQINDHYGHHEGDCAIRAAADALKACAGETDICARFGGDEFVFGGFVSAALTDIREEQFRQQFAKQLALFNGSAGKPYRVSASIGFYAAPAVPDTEPDQLLKAADDRMYDEKRAAHAARDAEQ